MEGLWLVASLVRVAWVVELTHRNHLWDQIVALVVWLELLLVSEMIN